MFDHFFTLPRSVVQFKQNTINIQYNIILLKVVIY